MNEIGIIYRYKNFLIAVSIHKFTQHKRPDRHDTTDRYSFTRVHDVNAPSNRANYYSNNDMMLVHYHFYIQAEEVYLTALTMPFSIFLFTRTPFNDRNDHSSN
ncbi:hypothetical protein RF11_01312 [Thelohanellus kitauei]|uniref:Uncharacterized protein n=1 Tax=Thelohanellus kitauei TaxID=669202 RepID=A0A0C2MWL5_THEKT|nr:hypothetical protein RF11_01312 [Thelohanellus kitauei]